MTELEMIKRMLEERDREVQRRVRSFIIISVTAFALLFIGMFVFLSLLENVTYTTTNGDNSYHTPTNSKLDYKINDKGSLIVTVYNEDSTTTIIDCHEGTYTYSVSGKTYKQQFQRSEDSSKNVYENYCTYAMNMLRTQGGK